MKIGKKAKSTAAVLAVMALTAGFSGVQAERVAVHDPLFGGPYVDSNEMGKALGIDSMQNDIGNLQTQITNVAEQANGAYNGMTQNAQDIDALQTQVGENTTDIADLQGTVADHQTQITNVAEQANAAFNGMTQNTQDISDLQTQVGQNTTDIAGFQDTVADHQTQINTIADQASDAEAKADGALKVQGNGVLYNHGTDLTTGINLNTMAIEQEVKDRETADQQLQQGINTNTAAINSVKTTVGSGILTSGAADLTTGINQNYAQIQQNYAQIQQNTNAINDLDNRVDDLDNEIDQVGAVSAALAGLHPLDYDGTGSKFQLSAAVGSYDSTQAAAIGAFYHFNRDVMVSLGGATSFDGDHKTAGNLGVTFRIGAGASGKSVSDDVMARLEAMDQKIAALEQENKDLKNVLGAIDTSLSKEFPDVPANHWAYEAVSKLAGNDIVSGYPDGEFHGDRTMTRYEMAEIIYKAMNRGVQVDQKLVEEFKPEMEQVAANQNA